MTIDLYINEANDYAQDIGAPIYHPHVSVIHYDEVGEIRHTLNRISCYGIFMQEEFPEGLTYGIGTYHEGDGSLMAYSPGQICGKLDDGTRRQYHGWVLLFDNELIQGSLIEQKLNDYQFFSYHSNEALILTPEEKDVLSQLMANLRRELETQSQSFGHNEIIRNYILLVLDYCNRFYYRQFKEMTAADSDILSRFQQVLTDYYTRGILYYHWMQWHRPSFGNGDVACSLQYRTSGGGRWRKHQRFHARPRPDRRGEHDVRLWHRRTRGYGCCFRWQADGP